MNEENNAAISSSFRRSLRAGFWLGLILAASSVLFASNATGQVRLASSSAEPPKLPRQVPEAKSAVLLGTSLLALGGVVLAGRLGKKLISG